MPTVPKLTDVSASLADLVDKRARLMAEAQRLRRELLALAREPEELSSVDPREAEALKLLGRVQPRTSQTKSDRIADMNRSIATHEAAANLLDREIAAEEGKASAIVRGRVKAEYERRLKALCHAMLGVAAANKEVGQIEDELEAGRVFAWSQLRPDLLDFLGSPRDRYAAVNTFLRQAGAAGLLADKDVPAEARL
jgi:hypothetical protein